MVYEEYVPICHCAYILVRVCCNMNMLCSNKGHSYPRYLFFFNTYIYTTRSYYMFYFSNRYECLRKMNKLFWKAICHALEILRKPCSVLASIDCRWELSSIIVVACFKYGARNTHVWHQVIQGTVIHYCRYTVSNMNEPINLSYCLLTKHVILFFRLDLA